MAFENPGGELTGGSASTSGWTISTPASTASSLEQLLINEIILFLEYIEYDLNRTAGFFFVGLQRLYCDFCRSFNWKYDDTISPV